MSVIVYFKVLQWPLGAMMAQACHASTAVMHLYYEDPNTQAYLTDLDNMHKCVLEVVFFLKLYKISSYVWFFKVTDEPAIQALSQTLTEKKIDHKLWIEQPENIPTCLVMKPYPKSEVQSVLRHLKLYKG